MLHASSLHQQNSPSPKSKKSPISFAHFFSGFKKIHSLDIIDFTRELALLLDTGISITNALNIIANNHEKHEMQKLISTIKTEIESGKLLGNVLRNYPEYFNAFFIQLILVGEQSGSLEIQLRQAADHLEKWLNLKNKLKKALTYPVFVTFFTLSIMSAVLIFIVPQFQNLFQSFDSELPFLTLLVIHTSHYFKYAVVLLFIGLILCLPIFYKLKKNAFQFPLFLDQFFLKAPLIGIILRQHLTARICHLLAVTYGAGIPFPNALILLSKSIKNQVYSKALSQIQIQIQKGIALHQAIKNTHLFPKRMTQMIYIGEQSGELFNMFKKMSAYYENQMDYRLEQINKLLEPVMIVALGLSIGFLIIAMYLPIFQIGSLF